MKHNVITESTILLWKYVTLLFQGMTPTQSKNNSLKKKNGSMEKIRVGAETLETHVK